jgi:hypothetical protein
MSKITDIKIIKEFTNDEKKYGVYDVAFENHQEIFIRNNGSVGVVSFFFDRPASQCVSTIRDDVKEDFFDILSNK